MNGQPATPGRRVVVAVALVAAGVAASIAAGGGASGEPDLRQISRPQPVVVNHSYLSPLVEAFGDVRIGRGVFVASNTILRADPGRRVCLGSRTNVQDNTLILALRGVPAGIAGSGPCGRRATTALQRVSVAHQAQIVNSRIGRFTFIGFRAQLTNVRLGDGAFVLHGARVANVRIPPDRLVPVGAVITRQAQADALPRKAEAHSEFQREVLEVNREFAEHYGDLYRRGGFDAVTGVGPAPRTSFNAGRRPTIGPGAVIEPFARIVGDVRLGARSKVGRRTAIRADEGAPIIIGARAEIEDRVTFHALRGTSIRIGRDLDTDDNVVFHGPLVVGDRLSVADDAILFRARVGDDVTVGDGAVVVGPADDPLEIPDGTRIPAGAVITTQAHVDAL